MKNAFFLFRLFFFSSLIFSCNTVKEFPFRKVENVLFDAQIIFKDERFPNVIVATDGTVIATWGRENFRVRCSEDGGKTWGPEITITNPGFQGGGTTVDEGTGDILVFVEEGHPPAPLTVYRSRDHGKTWKAEKVIIKPNSLGHIPSMHMNERGITLKHGKYAGRLIRPARWYGSGNGREFWDEHYTNAIYSDDGGKTWQAGEPFPVYGTGEAAIEELSDGTLYYNSRRHKSTDEQSPLWRYSGYSYNGGRTWIDDAISDVLPDGNQNTDYGLMGGLVRFPIEEHDILIFSNIDVPKLEGEDNLQFEQRGGNRIRGTVWASFDGGKSWPVKRLVDEGSFAYSSMAAGRKGTTSEGWIYLLYESNGGAIMARFNLAWIMNGRNWKSFLP